MNYLDIFSIPVQLNYKNQFFVKSQIGFVSSLAIQAIIITVTVFLMLDLFEHQQAKVVSKMQFSVEPDDFQLTSNNFQIVLTLQDSNNSFIINTPNQTYYSLQVDFISIKQQKQNGSLQTSFLIDQGIVRQCTENDATYVFLFFMKNLFQGLNPVYMTKFYCLDQKTFENKTLGLGGDNSQSHVRTVRVQVLKCINSPECAPFEKVQAKLSGAKVNIGFYDQFLDSTKYTTPLQRVVRLKQFSLNVDEISRTKMWMRRITIQTDENFFLLNNKRDTQEALQFKTFETSFNQPINIKKVKPSIKDFMFEIDQQEEYTYRTYGNILEVMASISGFYRFITFLAGILLNPIIKKIYFTAITSEINKNYEQSEKILLQYSQPLSPKVENKINTSWLDKIKHLGFQNLHKNFIKENDILKCMDIMRIIQISQDIQRLKNIVLSKEQRILFDLIPIPLNNQNSQGLNQLGESIKFVQSQNNFINFNIKQCLFQNNQESPDVVYLPEEIKSNSIIPDEIKSQRDLQEYQIIVNSKNIEHFGFHKP